MIFLSSLVASRLLLTSNPLVYFWSKFELRLIPGIFTCLFFSEILGNFFCIRNFRSRNICSLRKLLLLLRIWFTEIKTIETCSKVFLIIADVTRILWTFIKYIKRILRWLLLSGRLRCWSTSSIHSGKKFTLLCRWCLKLWLLVWTTSNIFFFFKQISILIYTVLPLRLLWRSSLWSFIIIICLLWSSLSLSLLGRFEFIKFFLVLVIWTFLFIITKIKIRSISLLVLFPIDLCPNSTK